MIETGGVRRKGWRGATLTGLFAGLALLETACNRDPVGTPEASFDAGIASAVQEVLEGSPHPWLLWPHLTEVALALADLYRIESDQLVWFEDARPHPALASAIDGLAKAAEHALNPSDYDSERIQAERPTQVNLREPLRVVIFYDTVHVNSENVVHFVGDIYGHDRILDEALARGYPYPQAE